MSEGVIATRLNKDTSMRRAIEDYQVAFMAGRRKDMARALDFIYGEVSSIMPVQFVEDLRGTGLDVPEDLRAMPRPSVTELAAVYEVMAEHMAARGINAFQEYVPNPAQESEAQRVASWTGALRG